MPETSSPTAARPTAAEPLAFLTRAEAATAAAAMGRIFPDDELGPGAIAAGTVYLSGPRPGRGRDASQDYYRVRPAPARCCRSVPLRRRFRTMRARAAGRADRRNGRRCRPRFGRSPAAPAVFQLLAQSHHRGDVFRSGPWRQSRPRRLEAARLSRAAAELQPRRTAARRGDRARPDLYRRRLSFAARPGS